MKLLSILFVACGLTTVSIANAAVDADAAQALLKKSGCMTCHAIDKDKMGPSFKKVAKNHKGKADAEDKVTKQITTKPTVTVDGNKMEHKAIASTNPAEIKNVVQWILAQ